MIADFGDCRLSTGIVDCRLGLWIVDWDCGLWIVRAIANSHSQSPIRTHNRQSALTIANPHSQSPICITIANPQSQSPIRNHNRQSAITIANPQSTNRQSSIRNPQFLWLLLLLEAPTERQMEIDPLHPLLGLHPDKPCPSRVQRELTL